MSETTIKKNRKRVVATALVAGLCSLGMVGGTLAALSTSITDGAETHHIYSDEVNPFGFAYTSASQEIDADVSIKPGPSNTWNWDTTNLIFENTGSIPANYAFYVDPDSLPAIDADNPIYDEAFVQVSIPVWASEGYVEEQWIGTLREFLSTAIVTDHVLMPGASTAVTVRIASPNIYTWDSYDGGEAIDITFGSKLTFNQLDGDRSSLLHDYAMANGTQRGSYLFPGKSSYSPWSELTGNQNSSWAIPSADVAGLTL